MYFLFKSDKKHSGNSLHRRNLKTQQSPVILDLCLRKTRSGKSHDYRDAIAFEKLRFHSVFRLRENEKPAFSNSSGVKSVFEKLRLRDGLVWTVGLTVEIKLRFQALLM